MKTKILLTAMMLSISLSLFAQSGTCGTNLTWNLSDGTLTITGTGSMNNYNSVPNTPWYSYRTSIKTVIIEDGATSIGDYAFLGCSSLTSVTIPNSVTSIGNNAFYNCTGLTSITIPNSVTTIGNNAFLGCTSLTSITIPNSVTTIGYHAFENCTGLTSITIPNSVTTIGYHAFENCTGLTSITMGNSVTTIGNSAFSSCSSLTSITIPSSVTTIGEDAFRYCTSLTSITIPNSVTSIGYSAFENCSSLTAVTIGNSVSFIGSKTFANCKKITTITIYAEAPPSVSIGVSAGSFEGITCSDITLYVPTQWIPLYKYDTFWRVFNIKGIDATDLKYTVTWKNYDGSVLETDENVAAGTIPAYNGATPVKPADEQYTYTFAGWSPSVTTITGETTYIATFSATFKANTYTIHVNQDCTSYMEEQQ